jgi:hypothetical protein
MPQQRDRRRYRCPGLMYVDFPGPRFRSIMLGVAFKPWQRQGMVERWAGMVSKPGAVLRVERL